ncbi:hypothetical protein KAK06_18795 [Ideonella sp. 4Y11]|uniref:Uncharacterized protein n=1 Tax=Ideonella aquatica TaxID=2824119 RepID=A0A940YN91_9BURK|nr:hypothetical protein [Ideonella aquatica]MBQ0961011.1 hypothetical protein [Ideonella aquatica]
MLAEVLNRIPRQHVVVSATTDGFLTSAPREHIDLTGPLSRRYQRLCWWALPGSDMLEVKHGAEQVVCMKTRGQLTARPMAGQEIVVAKAGVQPTVRITKQMTPEQIRRAQNDELLQMYLHRTPGSTVVLKAFPSLRDQWEKGVDLIKASNNVRMSLEFDLKRRLVDARELVVLGWNTTHVAASTQPWATVAEFELARARLDQLRAPPRKKRAPARADAPLNAEVEGFCIKTVDDVARLEQEIGRGRARGAARAQGRPVLNMGRDGLRGMLKRAFLRVYTRNEMGLVRKYTYTQMAQWFTDFGLATTTQEVKTARTQPVVLASVPRAGPVMELLRELEILFPEADLRPLLVSLDEAEDSPYGDGGARGGGGDDDEPADDDEEGDPN